MKKFLCSLLAITMVVPMLVMAEEEKDVEKEPVKVYIFEAGGCSACEAETAYLESLESYNEKFKVIHKELYVDHNTWAQGKDYKLGVKVVNYCHTLGFTEAVTTATPLIVISDIYCDNSYNASLEEVIDKAYEEGDKDIVSLFSNSDKLSINPVVLFGVLGAAVVVIGAIVAVVVLKDKNEAEKNVKKDNQKEIMEEKATKNEKNVESRQPKKTTNNSKKSNSKQTKKNK